MRRPAALTFAVVVAVLQVVTGVLAAVLGVLAALASSAGDRAAATAGSANPWAGFGVAIGGAVGAAGLATAVVLGVPLLVLRGGSPTRRVTGHGMLVGAELLLLVPVALFLHVRFGTVFAVGRDPFSGVLDLLVAVPLLVVGCLLVPSARRWSTAAAPRP